jgi:Tol biopolymer transport system component
MGEVYKARDARLNRDVALKVLPEAFSRDTQRMARFEREAKLLASLNHTNIATIYGLEESGPTRALVMELVEGPTLADRIATGPIPLDEALLIARQIAEAVEYAHEQNVIHRDLKPANIKVKEDGALKVLDFGLAKAMSDEISEADMSNSPTLSMAATRAGIILGTAAYMSPEQARGKRVDRRTDIWAFGVVLYEMLTAKQAFEGEDMSLALASVMKSDPDWNRLPKDLPLSLRNVLQRCLQKDPKQRIRDMGDVRLAMEGMFETAASPTSVKDSAAGALGPVRWLGWAIATVLVIALGVLSFVHFREAPPTITSEMRTDISTPATDDPVSFAISPDGREFVFVAAVDGPAKLWLRFLNKTEAQPLPGTEGAAYPFWSPDSRSVGFFAQGKLKRLDLGGGAPLVLADAIGRGGSWSSDGTILFAPNAAGPLFRISSSGGQPEPVTRLDKQTGHRFPRFLPDGRQFVFYVLGSQETSGIYLGSLDSHETKRLAVSDAQGAFLASGWLLLVRGGTLLAQQFDFAKKELTGTPLVLADSVATNAGAVASAVSVSNTGLVAYRPGRAGKTQSIWFDRSGKQVGTMGEPNEDGIVLGQLSPDGRREVVGRVVQGNGDVWIIDESRMTRFTFDPALDRYPIWSADGHRIVFDSSRTGQRDLFIKDTNGAGNETLLLQSTEDKSAADWSRDGRFLLYSSVDPKDARDLWILPMDGDRKPFIFLKTPFDERSAKFSPDGRWVAYASNLTGRYEIYVSPFNGTSSASSAGPPVSTQGGVAPRWRHDGKELYYIAPDLKLMAVRINTTGATFEAGNPTTLFATRILGGADPNIGTQYDVSADGRFLINTVLGEDNSPITLIQNWNPEAKK